MSISAMKQEPVVQYIDYRLFGLRPPDAFETPLSWEEVLVWLRIKDEQ